MALEISSFAVSQLNNVAIKQYALTVPMESNEKLKNRMDQVALL